MAKAADAFRTISEVSSQLDTPTHVLRFWESKFSQVKPVKRAGGRRYYRPQDISLLGGIKHLLHEQGLTIKGVQKLLRDEGVKHVASLAGATSVEESVSAPEPKATAKPQSTPLAASGNAEPFFAMYHQAQAKNVRANASQIAPLVAQLEDVHRRMHQG